jgi:predicted NBD/HSP70 family sugar kinase
VIRTIRRRRQKRITPAEGEALAARLLAGDPQIAALLDRIIAEGDRALAELLAELEAQPPLAIYEKEGF